MALIKTGGIVTQLSGKIGGQSFGTGRSGPYLKNIGSYKTNSSRSAKNTLALFSYASQLWRGLSFNEREAWASAAENFPYINRVNDSKIYSGFNLFVKFNGNLISCGLDTINEPPEPYSFEPADNFTVSNAGGGINLNASGLDSESMFMFFMSNPVSKGRNASGLNFRLIAVRSADQIQSGEGVSTQYYAIAGKPPVGTLLHWRLKAVHETSGQSIDSYSTGLLVFNNPN